MFSFPWPSVARNERAPPETANLMPPATSMTQTPTFNKMKRKRDNSRSMSPHLDFPMAKRTTETMSHVQIPAPDLQQVALPGSAMGSRMDKVGATNAPETAGNGVIPPPRVHGQTQSSLEDVTGGISHTGNKDRIRQASVGRTTALREAIEAQFGLEILLKHKELRLIDQEFAKCQAALEQLRRCQVVPYPALSSDHEAMQATISGSGNAFNNQAPYAPPWGVADGPYSRHYQRWLIPDSAFDDSVIEKVQLPRFAGKTMSERATRGSKSEIGMLAGKSRSQRGSTNARLQALPHGYPEPKEEKGPMIVKRGSDGKMVKLVCLDCRRSNFNSAQGFINHCRIAHSRQFASHDAAIEASGEETDVDAEGGLGEKNNAPQATASSALVHPLIRSSAQLARTSPIEISMSSRSSSAKRKKSEASFAMGDQQAKPNDVSHVISTPQQPKPARLADHPPFTPSPQTPHLSALFAKLGRGGDLDDMVTQAKAMPEVDLSLSSDDEDDDVMEVAAGTVNAPQSRSTRGVLRGGHHPVRQTKSPAPSEQSPIHHAFSSGSQKPAYLSDINVDRAYPSPYQSDDAQEEHHTSSTPFNLSPNTIEAHPAPSLVSDDGDYENNHSDSESPSSAEADDDDDHYIRAELIDHDDMDLGEGSSATHHIGLGEKPHAPSVRRRSSAMRPPMALHNGEAERRHVSFASPARRQRRDSRTANGK